MKLRSVVMITGVGTMQCLPPSGLECVVDQLEVQVAVLECVVDSEIQLVEVPRRALPPKLSEGGVIFIRQRRR